MQEEVEAAKEFMKSFADADLLRWMLVFVLTLVFSKERTQTMAWDIFHIQTKPLVLDF